MAVPGSRENEEYFVKQMMRLGHAIGDTLDNIFHSKPSPEGEGYDGADKPPVGSKPINETEWSGDHKAIKSGIVAGSTDDVRISPDGDVWSQNPDGTWTNYGPASSMTGSGRASGRRGKDGR